MKHHNRYRIPSELLVAFIAFVTLVPGPARAVQVSCETGNPCTTGVCLADGTCEASPANDGASCDTHNPCSTGVCADGNCAASPANNGASCETFDPCMQKNGQCSQGVCAGAALPNGSACRQDVLGPCMTGTCASVLTFTYCQPAFKCGDWTNPCEFNCNFATGECQTIATHVCDDDCTTATCTPLPDFEYSCTNVQNKADNTPCYDGNSCNGDLDKCQTGKCVGSGSSGAVCGDGSVDAPEECDDGDAEFASGDACDDLCMLVPCGKPTHSSGVPPKASDALWALKAGVHSVNCDLLVCDVNDSGTITASDALLILKKAVGNPVTLNCPVGGGGGGGGA